MTRSASSGSSSLTLSPSRIVRHHVSWVTEMLRKPRRPLVLGAALIVALIVESAAIVAQQEQIDDLRTQHIDLQGHLVEPSTSGPSGPLVRLAPWSVWPPGPPGKDGKDGQDGQDGQNGRDGRDGRDGPPGKDGKDGQDVAAEPSPTETRSLRGEAEGRALPGSSSVMH